MRAFFYAESWALVHYMNFGPDMDRGRKLDQFFALIQQGTDQEKAFHQVFGDFAPLDRELDQYMRSLAFYAAMLQEPEQKVNEKDYPAQKLTLAQTHAEMAEYKLWNHNPHGAQEMVDKALKEDPKLGLAHEAEGFLHYSKGEDSAAMEEFTQAWSLDPTLYLSLFSKTMMSSLAQSSAPADEAAFQEAMFKVVDLNSQFAPALVQLARLAVRENNLKLAYGESRRAEELEPSRAGYHLMTGEILLRMGQYQAAAQDAQYVAERWGDPDHDEAVDLWDAVPVADRPAGVNLTHRIPSGAKSTTGTIESFTCPTTPDQPLVVVLQQDGRQETFHTKGAFLSGFADTFWWGEDHMGFCHHLQGVRAVILYRPVAGYTGDMLEFAVRNDLPPSGKPASPQAAKQ